METRQHGLTTSIGLLILRIGAGGYMMTHGYGKLVKLTEGRFDEFADPIGLGSGLSLVLTVLAEFFCSLLVVFGAGTRFAALPIVFAMGVAAFVVHANDAWTMGEGASKEPALLYLSAFLALALTGAGRFSIDAVIRSRKSRRDDKQ